MIGLTGGADLFTGTGMEVGFYGKLPSHGDFLRRRVSDAFVGVWDAWLQECIAASRAILGDRWLDVYLTSPAWRFACAAGTFGTAPVAGVMVPSVDRVGRYFHLTFAVELPPGASVIAAATTLGTFFEGAEQLAVETLAADRIEFDTFDERVARLAHHLASLTARPRVMLDATASAILNEQGPASWHMPLGAPAQLPQLFEQLVAQRLAALYEPLSLWWTDGSAIVEPSMLIAKGLPHPDSFAALLDGGWTEHHWPSVPASVDGPAVEPDALLVDDPTPPRFRSAGSTDVGLVRAINQDAFLERPDVGLWVVADGLGGLSDGEIASRMVCDALADFIPDATFEQMLEGAAERLREVNDHLVRMAAREHQAVHSGSTVVALFTRATRCAVLWAGDSRAYRLRDGMLQQLTRDHSLAESGELSAGETSTAITRAVGGEPALTLDMYRDRVRAGDRFLLCSDGLTRTVADGRIQQLMAQENIRAAVDDLIAAAMAAGGPDNVTVVMVEAYT
jgi:type VI secretion system protein ImpM